MLYGQEQINFPDLNYSDEFAGALKIAFYFDNFYHKIDIKSIRIITIYVCKSYFVISRPPLTYSPFFNRVYHKCVCQNRVYNINPDIQVIGSSTCSHANRKRSKYICRISFVYLLLPDAQAFFARRSKTTKSVWWYSSVRVLIGRRAARRWSSDDKTRFSRRLFAFFPSRSYKASRSSAARAESESSLAVRTDVIFFD